MYPQRLLLPFCLILAYAGSFTCDHGSHPQQTNQPSPTISLASHPHDGYPLSSAKPYRFERSVHMMNSKAKSSRRRSRVRAKVVNVDRFGAKGDGRSDDTQAFEKAWREACSSRGPTQFAVPKNKIYVLKPITFSGPCRANLTIMVFGTIKASGKMEDYKKSGTQWIRVKSLQNLRVKGGGTVNGNGEIWWKNSCKVNKNLPCKPAPNAFTFHDCENLVVSDLRFRNSQKMHLSFDNCLNVRATRLVVTAPGNSPNTDGIHITGSRDIYIAESLIRTGDDCISIVSGSKNVEARDITCGPGHGISIGSLGGGNATAQVSGVLVNRATLVGTSNGVRIKTWQGGSGFAKDIKFENIVMKNVSNPIIIDQNYCDRDEPCRPQESAVKVTNVVYKGITGTSASKLAIRIECSKSVPCEEIVMQDVSLEAKGAEAECVSVELTRKGTVTPLCS